MLLESLQPQETSVLTGALLRRKGCLHFSLLWPATCLGHMCCSIYGAKQAQRRTPHAGSHKVTDMLICCLFAFFFFFFQDCPL